MLLRVNCVCAWPCCSPVCRNRPCCRFKENEQINSL